MSELADFMVHDVTVKTKLGSGSTGTRWAAPVGFTVFQDHARTLVRDVDAREVVSSTTLYDIDVSHAAAYRPGSEVTLVDGSTATVITCRPLTSGPLDLPDHLEVRLT